MMFLLAKGRGREIAYDRLTYTAEHGFLFGTLGTAHRAGVLQTRAIAIFAL